MDFLVGIMFGMVFGWVLFPQPASAIPHVEALKEKLKALFK
jgi:hypothetical protein